MAPLRMKRRPSLRISLAAGAAAPPRCHGVLDEFEQRGYQMGRTLPGGSGSASLRVVERGSEALLLKFAEHEEAACRLEQEYRILKAVAGHRNIVSAVDWHRSPQSCGFLMSYHPGVTLHRFYRTMAFDPAALQAHRLAAQLADALAYLHSRRVAHRDLHSQNVIVEASGSGACGQQQREKVTLIDFGSACHQAQDSSTLALRPARAERDVGPTEADGPPGAAAGGGAREEAGRRRCSSGGCSSRSCSRGSIGSGCGRAEGPTCGRGGVGPASKPRQRLMKPGGTQHLFDSLRHVLGDAALSRRGSNWSCSDGECCSRRGSKFSNDGEACRRASKRSSADDGPPHVSGVFPLGGLSRKASKCSDGGDSSRKASKCSDADDSLSRMAARCSVSGGLSRKASRCSDAEEGAVRMGSKCSAFAGECTMPLIMPPDRGPPGDESTSYGLGPGSAFKRDSFALGLLIAGLVRRKNTTTGDMYEGLGLRSLWASPAPPLRQELQAVILGLVRIDPQERLTSTAAAGMLPPPGCWFQDSVGCTELQA